AAYSDIPYAPPVVNIVCHRAAVHLHLPGAPRRRRDYRTRAAPAPLKETLAAAILRLGGWDRERPLVDPMCGSGTIPIEAALWARGIAPGLGRGRFGFERWACHDGAAARRAAELREYARSKILAEGPPIRGSDVDLEALA